VNFFILKLFYKGDLMDYYCFLSLDALPSVRQNAANNLVDFSEVVHMSIFDSKLTPRLEQFSFDQNVGNFIKFLYI